jgi:glycosyltransferase involved in cell wall biosynthesis
MTPDVSVIIPVYNRGDVIRYCLESVRHAATGLNVETIIVDDGSTIPVADTLPSLGYSATKIIRQANQGLLFARLAGFAAATGRHTLFLDSDDLVSSEKIRLQIAALDAGPADVCYTDTAHCTLTGEYDQLIITPDGPLSETADGAKFFISVQPVPHCPIFRTDWLRGVIDDAFFAPSPLYNSVAEIWFYHNAAPRPARVVKVNGPHTICGRHPGARLTDHWEKLAVGSLAVMEAFVRTCPNTPETARARQLVSEKAFLSWRRLPRGFSAEFCAREVAVWRRLVSTHRVDRLGGKFFQSLARWLGPLNAARLLRRWQNQPYATCRTLDDDDFAELLAAVPNP